MDDKLMLSKVKKMHKTHLVSEISKKIKIAPRIIIKIMKKNNLSRADTLSKRLNDKNFVDKFKKIYTMHGAGKTSQMMRIYFHNVIALAKKMKLTPSCRQFKAWTSSEITIIKKHYKGEVEPLLKMLPKRTRHAIARQAVILGLSKKRNDNVSIDKLLIQKERNMYYCGYLMGYRPITNKNRKQYSIACDRKIINDIIDIINFTGHISITKQGTPSIVFSYNKLNILKEFFYADGIFSANRIHDDRMFLCWFSGYLDRSYSLKYHHSRTSGNCIIKQCSHVGDISEYCTSRINLILGQEVAKLTKSLRISNSKLKAIAHKFKSLNITVGEFWRKIS